MNWEQALSEIESLEFDVRLNVASSLPLFLKAARQEPAVIGLYHELVQNVEVRYTIFRRLSDLSNSSVDPKYENPKDTALAVLLCLLELTSPKFAQIAARFVTNANNCWYAKKVSSEVLSSFASAVGDNGISDSEQTYWQTTSRSGGPIVTNGPLFEGDSKVYLYPEAELKSFHAGSIVH